MKRWNIVFYVEICWLIFDSKPLVKQPHEMQYRASKAIMGVCIGKVGSCF